MNKIAGFEDIRRLFHDGMSVMVGGFMGCGTPFGLIDALSELGIKDLTVITSDSFYPGRGVGKLIGKGMVKKLCVSHIGRNPDVGARMIEGALEVELVPMGSFAERIRAGGVGLGGVITPTGVGTLAEEGKQKLVLEGKEYLIELPLRADIALLRGSVVDAFGNTLCRGTTRNYGPLMAMAADTVIIEAQETVDIGGISPDHVHIPGIFIDYIVREGQ